MTQLEVDAGSSGTVLEQPAGLLIDGEWSVPAEPRTCDVISPFTNEAVGWIYEASPADVDRAVSSAREAFDRGTWRRLAPRDRATVMARVVQLIERDRDRLARLEALEMGKPISAARAGLSQAVFAWDYFAAKARDVPGSVVQVASGTHFNYRVHEPVGVVVEVIPWNGAVIAASQKMAAALATGNSVILKPSAEASLAALHFGGLLLEAGFPRGVVQILTGRGGTTGDALIRHPGVDMISLTGSVETGRHVVETLAGRLKRISLELGGKNPNVVFPDAEMSEAVTFAASAAFANAGQICVSGSRLLLHQSIHDAFLERLIAAARGMRLGDPMDPATQMGPLVSRRQHERVLQHIRIASAEGARLVLGGRPPDDAELARGNFVLPTIFADVMPAMRIAREEVFGPVLCVLSFRDEEEAVRIANDVDYGLAGAVWTTDIDRALRVGAALQAGQIYVNGYYSPAMCESPGLGRKQSGLGEAGYLKYTVPKTVFVRPRAPRSPS